MVSRKNPKTIEGRLLVARRGLPEYLDKLSSPYRKTTIPAYTISSNSNCVIRKVLVSVVGATGRTLTFDVTGDRSAQRGGNLPA